MLQQEHVHGLILTGPAIGALMSSTLSSWPASAAARGRAALARRAPSVRPTASCARPPAFALQPAASEMEAASSDASSRTFEAPLEQSMNTRRAGRERKGEGHKCHFTNLYHSTRLEMSFLIKSMCCRPNTNFIMSERQFQL